MGDTITLNGEKLVHFLSKVSSLRDLDHIKLKILELKKDILNEKADGEETSDVDRDKKVISFRKDILVSQLDQILESRTIERARYYIKRLKRGIQEVKTAKINDINLLRWKEYDEIITDSLWIFDKRESSGAHLGWYWGNFIPQIPHQLILRYTKQGEWVLDPFVGSGTTLIECRRLGRNGIGIELNPEVAEKAKRSIEKEPNIYNVVSDIYVGDSRTMDIKSILDSHKVKRVQLVIMHPPYHDIIKFSSDPRDLSNARNVKEFLAMFQEVLENVTSFLEKERFLVLVIGDKYSKGEWIPLGFYCMEEVLKRNFSLKSIVVKNFEGTRGKRNQEELWRYRALVGGFYIFKHEYIMLFKKKKEREKTIASVSIKAHIRCETS